MVSFCCSASVEWALFYVCFAGFCACVAMLMFLWIYLGLFCRFEELLCFCICTCNLLLPLKVFSPFPPHVLSFWLKMYLSFPAYCSFIDCLIVPGLSKGRVIFQFRVTFVSCTYLVVAYGQNTCQVFSG